MENSLQNYNYFVYSESSKKAVFFDPLDIDITLPIAKELGLEVVALMNTHHHPDHNRDNEKLLSKTNATLIELKDGEVYNLSETETIRAVYTPGHIDPHFCFFLGDNSKEWGIITGDLIFNGGVGNTRSGDINVLADTIVDTVSKWDGDLKIYPSHDYMLTNLEFSKTIDSNHENIEKWIKKKEDAGRYFVTTLSDEREFNPFFKTNEKEEFKKIRIARNSW